MLPGLFYASRLDGTFGLRRGKAFYRGGIFWGEAGGTKATCHSLFVVALLTRHPSS